MSVARHAPPSAGVLPRLQTFGAILWRDIFVTSRELTAFLAQVFLQPLFTLLIFGKVLADLGYTSAGLADVLLPGIVALNTFLAALQNTTLPLVLDFSFTREIEDRLLSPVPVGVVAVEKMVFGALRGLVAGVLMIPVGFLMLDVSWPLRMAAPVVAVLMLGGLAGAALGMALGTVVSARRIEVTFSVVLTPLMFTGATQFPLREIDSLPWFQVLCALNPLTYLSEAMRALVAPPSVVSVPLWLDLIALTGALGLFGAIAIVGFRRRSLD